jgi:hypothetical protein
LYSLLDGFTETLVFQFHLLSGPDGRALATPPVFVAFDGLRSSR